MALKLPSIGAHNGQPVTAQNAAFLPRIAYRGDDYSSLRYWLLQHLQDAFPTWNSAAAANRGTQDFGVVFAEMFAYLGEILGFYQDCHANEVFLRTANLTSSLAGLCQLIGYTPSPGASASVLQAFTLNSGTTGVIPAGFQVKTKANNGIPAMVFETGAPLQADAARNTLFLYGYNRSTRILNATGAPAASTVLLDSGYGGLAAGSFVIFSGLGKTPEALQLTAVTAENGNRRITWKQGELKANANLAIAELTIYGKPAQAMKLADAARADEIALGAVSGRVTNASSFEDNDRIIFVAPGFQAAAVVWSHSSGGAIRWDRAFNTALARSETTIYNAGRDGFAVVSAELRPGVRQIPSDNPYLAAAQPGDMMIIDPGDGGLDIVRVSAVNSAFNTYYLSDPVPRYYPNGATLFKATPADPENGIAGEPHSTFEPLRIDARTISLTLDKTYEGLTPGALVVLSDGAYTRVNKVAAAQVDSQNRTVLTLAKQAGEPFLTGALTVYGPFQLQMRVNGYNQSEASIAPGITSLQLDGPVSGLAPGSYLALVDGETAEGVRVTGITAGAAYTTVDLETPLQNGYALATTVISGNVAPASHGQTIVENSLGSGDGSVASQTFKLHQQPVSYIHDASGARGVVNSLQIFVGEEEWTEVATLAASSPQDHHYTTAIDEDQWMYVTFGDGVHGAKLPTGTDNVAATYRIGIGSPGNVAVAAINSLTAPPAFLLSSANPIAAAGGQDPETPLVTKTAAPVTVRTLDRAVSVEDFADLALTFAGIGKARAYWQRIDGRNSIRLVVATTGGQPLPAPLASSLAGYLDLRRSPQVNVIVQDYRAWPVRLELDVNVLPLFLQSDVNAALLIALGSGTDADGNPGYFNFTRRELGTDLYLSDVYALVQSIAGVDYAVVRQFHNEAAAGAGPLDVVTVPDDAVATGGDSTDAAAGVLIVRVTGGVV